MFFFYEKLSLMIIFYFKKYSVMVCHTYEVFIHSCSIITTTTTTIHAYKCIILSEYVWWERERERFRCFIKFFSRHSFEMYLWYVRMLVYTFVHVLALMRGKSVLINIFHFSSSSNFLRGIQFDCCWCVVVVLTTRTTDRECQGDPQWANR